MSANLCLKRNFFFSIAYFFYYLRRRKKKPLFGLRCSNFSTILESCDYLYLFFNSYLQALFYLLLFYFFIFLFFIIFYVQVSRHFQVFISINLGIIICISTYYVNFLSTIYFSNQIIYRLNIYLKINICNSIGMIR